MDLDKLERLAEQLEKGNITKEDYELGKQKILGTGTSISVSEDKFGMTDDTFNMVMHLSQYLGFIVPFLGFIAPLFLWLKFKDTDPEVDRHGKAIINWNISVIIYVVVGLISMIFFVGIILLIALAIVGFIYPIIGALKAKDGEVFSYPPTIKIL